MNYIRAISEKAYGKPNVKLVDFAFGYLFPDKVNDTALRKRFTEYVNSRFNKIGCVVIWERAGMFNSGNKEVIITPTSVKVSDNYRKQPPKVAFSL